MTQLRQILLEELVRRNYAQSTIATTSARWSTTCGTSTVPPTSLAWSISASTRLRHKPTMWLFPGNRWHTSSRPVTTKVLWTACRQASVRAGLEHKHIHPHTPALLRNASSRSRC